MLIFMTLIVITTNYLSYQLYCRANCAPNAGANIAFERLHVVQVSARKCGEILRSLWTGSLGARIPCEILQ